MAGNLFLPVMSVAVSNENFAMRKSAVTSQEYMGLSHLQTTTAIVNVVVA